MAVRDPGSALGCPCTHLALETGPFVSPHHHQFGSASPGPSPWSQPVWGGATQVAPTHVPRSLELRDGVGSAGGKQKMVVQGMESDRLERWTAPPGCLMGAHEVSATEAGRAGGGVVPFGGILRAAGAQTLQVPSVPHHMDPSPGQTGRTRQAQQDLVPTDGMRKFHLPAKPLVDFQPYSL